MKRARKFQHALKKASGCWTDVNPPDLKTQADVNQYLARFRGRFRRLARPKGWLDKGNAFFQVMQKIIEERRRHRPRG